MVEALKHLEMLNEYANIARGGGAAGWGSRAGRAESFARRQGAEYPLEVNELIAEISEREQGYSDATGLPPGSFVRFYREARTGARLALKQETRDGRA